MRWENLCGGEGLCGGEEEKRKDCSGQQIPIALKSSGGVMVTIIVCRLVVAVMRRKEEFCDGIKWLRWPCAEISVARTLMALVYTLGKRNFSCSRVRHGEC